MKRMVVCMALAAIVLTAVPTFAELQNVVVGGQVRVRGNWYTMDNDSQYGLSAEKFVEQRSTVNFRADFTENVSAFVELESYNWWGDDFRSNYLNGIDVLANDSVGMYQGYVEAREMFGTPLRIRAGRQEMKFGGGWLVGTNDSSPYFTGLSFDGIRATYAGEKFTVDAFATKLADRSPIEEDGDTDFYGVYASCTAVENVTFDAYWLYLRDANTLKADFHTVGLRAAGTVDAFNFDAEASYQFGQADNGPYAGKDFGNFACNVLAGYGIDVAWKPRPFVGVYYLQGDDNGYGFNRLFSDVRFGKTIDSGHWLTGGTGFADSGVSNVLVPHVGVMFNPTEKLMGVLHLAYATEDADDGIGAETDGELGWELEASGAYQYSKDLSVQAGYVHLFASDNLQDGARICCNGLAAGAVSDDVNYFFVETRLTF